VENPTEALVSFSGCQVYHLEARFQPGEMVRCIKATCLNPLQYHHHPTGVNIMSTFDISYVVGRFILRKYRNREDTGAAARALRKQGYPLWLARLILLGK
jgi:hypothetical protein